MRRYVVVGGLAAFAAFGLWLSARQHSTSPPAPGWRRVYFGAIDAPAPRVRCSRAEYVRIGYNSKTQSDKYRWTCLARDTTSEGNLYFEFYDTDTERKISVLTVGLDGRDYYGARYHDVGDTLAFRALDREVLP